MFRIYAALAATCALALPVSPASAQQAAGDWRGTLSAAGQSFRIAIHLRRSQGGPLTGVYDNLDLGQFEVPIADIAEQPGLLSFGHSGSGGRFEGRWDAAAGAWVGQLTIRGQRYPLQLAPGRFPVGPTFAALDGAWGGTTVVAPGLRASLMLRFRSSPYGTVGMLSGLDDIPHPTEDLALAGGHYQMRVPTTSGTFVLSLTPLADTLAGELTQGGARFPLTLTRAAAAP